MAGTIRLQSGTSPATPPTGTIHVYSKTDKKLYIKDDTGAEFQLTLGTSITNTDDLPEGAVNLYFTAERAQDAVGAALTASPSITLVYDDPAGTITANINNSAITDVLVSPSAAIQLSKLAALSTNRALATNASGVIVATSVTDTELGYVSGVTSSIQTQLNSKQPGGVAVTSLTGDVTGTGPGATATTIAAGAITDSKVSSSAAIALSKLAATTASRALQSDGSGVISSSSVTSTELGYLSGATSSIQTQLNSKQATGNYITSLTGPITATGPGAAVTSITNGSIDLTTKVTGTLPLGSGGTGLATTPTAGQLLIGNGTGYTLSTLTPGLGSLVTNTAGSITVGMLPGDKNRLDASVNNPQKLVNQVLLPTTVAGWGVESGTNYTVGATSRQAVVRGNYLWDLSFTTPGMIFCYDITDRVNPVLLSAKSLVTTATPPGNSGPRSLVVDSTGRYAYISMSTGQINILDYQTKSNPTFLNVTTSSLTSLKNGSLTLSPAPLGAAFDVALNGNYLYVTDAGNSGSNTGNGFYVVDVTTPASPTVKWNVTITGGAGRNRSAGVDTVGNYLFVSEFDNNASTYNQSRLLVYDISSVNAAAPTLVGSVALNQGGLGAVVAEADGNTVYVTNRNNTAAFFVVNTTTKTAPTLSATVNLPGGIYPADIKSVVSALANKYIYVCSSSTSSLWVYDVSTPALPNLAFTTTITGSTTGLGAVAVLDGLVYIPNRDVKSLDIYNNFTKEDFVGSITGSQATFNQRVTSPLVALANVTTTQRNALTPSNGMEVYNSTTNQFEFYQNGAWIPFSGASITSLTGDVTGTGPGATATTIANGVITDAKVSSSAAIGLNKLAPLTGLVTSFGVVTATDTVLQAFGKLANSESLHPQTISSDFTVPTGYNLIRGYTALSGSVTLAIQGTGIVRIT